MLNDLYDEEKIIRIGIENAVTKATRQAREAGQTRALQLTLQMGLILPEQLTELQNQLAACGRCALYL